MYYLQGRPDDYMDRPRVIVVWICDDCQAGQCGPCIEENETQTPGPGCDCEHEDWDGDRVSGRGGPDGPVGRQ